MTPQEIAIVQGTYTRLDEHRVLFAQAFYDRLFRENPNIALMFERNMEEQIEKFRVMLFTAVYGLNRSEELKPALRNLGRRHISYGVRASDYTAFEVALLGALEQFLGTEFTPEVRGAWKSFYSFLTEPMREGANLDAAVAQRQIFRAKERW
jgi:hemoglobin-like flavoprotein